MCVSSVAKTTQMFENCVFRAWSMLCGRALLGSGVVAPSEALGQSCMRALLGLDEAFSLVMRCLSSFGVLISQKIKENFKKFPNLDVSKVALSGIFSSCAAPSLSALCALTRASPEG